MTQMSVYAIIPGGDVFCAMAVTRGQAMDLAMFIKRYVPGSLGVSFHGAGLSGEVGFRDVSEALMHSTLPYTI